MRFYRNGPVPLKREGSVPGREVFRAGTCNAEKRRVEHGRWERSAVGPRVATGFHPPLFLSPDLRKGRLDGRDYELPRQHVGYGRDGPRFGGPDRCDDLPPHEATRRGLIFFDLNAS